MPGKKKRSERDREEADDDYDDSWNLLCQDACTLLNCSFYFACTPYSCVRHIKAQFLSLYNLGTLLGLLYLKPQPFSKFKILKLNPRSHITKTI